MKYLVQLNDLNLIDELLKRQVFGIVVGVEVYSNGQALSLSCQEIENLVKKVQDKTKIYVLMNQLYHEYKLDQLAKVLEKLANSHIDGVFFQDFGLLNLVKQNQYDLNLIYQPDTLNTNHQTLNTLKDMGVDGFMLSSQLHEDEVKEIVKKTNAMTIVQIHGVQYISCSRRKLLTNYFEVLKQNRPTDYKQNYIMKVSNSEDYSYIYEDDYGTHVYTVNELCTLDKNLDNEYGYIETLYLDPQYVLEVIDAYQNKVSEKDFIEQHLSHHFDHGFLDDGTVYKIEDVRRLEANETNK